MMINEMTKKIDNSKTYKESGIKHIMKDSQNTAKVSLGSGAPELSKE